MYKRLDWPDAAYKIGRADAGVEGLGNSRHYWPSGWERRYGPKIAEIFEALSSARLGDLVSPSSRIVLILQLHLPRNLYHFSLVTSFHDNDPARSFSLIHHSLVDQRVAQQYLPSRRGSRRRPYTSSEFYTIERDIARDGIWVATLSDTYCLAAASSKSSTTTPHSTHPNL